MSCTVCPLIVVDEMSCKMIGVTFGQQVSLLDISYMLLSSWESKFITRTSYSKCQILNTQ